MAHHLLFEGAELTGKSFTIHGVWDFLEARYNSGLGVMDGCVWFNADVGVFGTDDGWGLIDRYIDIAKTLKHKNLIFEKLHLTNLVYTISQNFKQFKKVDKQLHKLGFKIVLTTYKNDPRLVKTRLQERLKGVPSYQRIAKEPSDYLARQEEYIKLLERTQLPYLVVDNSKLPNTNYKKILSWLGEV